MQLVRKNEWNRAGMTNIITTLTGVTEKIVKKNMMREFDGNKRPIYEESASQLT